MAASVVESIDVAAEGQVAPGVVAGDGGAPILGPLTWNIHFRAWQDQHGWLVIRYCGSIARIAKYNHWRFQCRSKPCPSIKYFYDKNHGGSINSRIAAERAQLLHAYENQTSENMCRLHPSIPNAMEMQIPNTIKRLIFDVDKFDVVREGRWHINNIRVGGRLGGQRGLIYRFIWNGPLPAKIDHISRDPMDCRIVNMRDGTKSVNENNRYLSSNNTSGHNGISWIKGKHLWQVGWTERAAGKGRRKNFTVRRGDDVHKAQQLVRAVAFRSTCDQRTGCRNGWVV